jgi:D-serine deaminase-like pyridoxal phosphate-dependent protein
MSDAVYSFEGQDEIFSPQLIYYPQIIKENIDRMIRMAGGAERLWPHIKTHKMTEVVRMQMEAGIDRFKCATIAEAEMAAEAGAGKLALAYPLVGPNIRRFLALSAAYPKTEFFAIGDDTEQIEKLGAAACAEGRSVNVLMDMDLGQHRTGVKLDRAASLYEAWSRLPGICMRGMHCYDGHRHETSRKIREDEVSRVDVVLEDIKKALVQKGLDCGILIMGGTPSFPCHAEFTGEYLSPGTCVVQDADYRRWYQDLDFVPGAAVLTRVVSRPGEDTFTMDMGTKAVASDPQGERGEIVGMEYAHTVMQNEEHWVVQVPPEHVKDIPAIGTELFVIPSHVCPTTALYPEVLTVEDGRQKGWWKVAARNRKINF